MAKFIITILFLGHSVFVFGQNEAITELDIKKHINYLASDKLQGRMTGTEGANLAAEYIMGFMEAYKLKPFGDMLNTDEISTPKETGKLDISVAFTSVPRSYYQNFLFTADIQMLKDSNKLEINTPTNRASDIMTKLSLDYSPLNFTENGNFNGEVVFAGYGIVMPENNDNTNPHADKKPYNSYKDLDVKDKVVIIFQDIPANEDVKRKQELNRYSDLRFKAMMAREKGAKALIVIASNQANKLIPLKFGQGVSGTGILAMNINNNLANNILRRAGYTLKNLQEKFDAAGTDGSGGFVLKDTKINLSTGIEKLKKDDKNVLAMLSNTETPESYIIVGAHYDHIGHGETGSLAKKGYEGGIHNGADDNASGTSTVLELMEYFQKNTKLLGKKAIIFALWSGEELGLIGSNHFAENPTISLTNVLAYINFDMVGRLKDNKLQVQGTGSAAEWDSLVTQLNKTANFEINLQADPFLPTDVTAFYPKKVPVINFFTGSHEDYHSPTDDVEKLNLKGIERVALLSKDLIIELLKRDKELTYKEVIEKKSRSMGPMRVSVGTIPDYAYEKGDGMRITGVKPASPADKAGLKPGDVITSLAGQTVKNVYDYTYILGVVKPDVEVDLEALRDGQKLKLKVSPVGR